jgi:Phospholipase_D-nuclease N-terminal
VPGDGGACGPDEVICASLFLPIPLVDAIKITWENTMLFEGGFTFTNFVADAFAVFMFILWFWLLITVSGDLFRRHDVSGFGKVLWVILLIVLPYIGIFAYIFTQGRGMAERNEARVKEARGELRQAVGFSVADEIEKLDRLKSTGSISEQEYSRLRSRIVQ